VFSFYPNKHITTGEGGMVVTDNQYLANECQLLRNLYFQEPRRFVHEKLAWNYRMSNIQAALGLAQLEKIEDKITKKRYIGKMYNRLFKGFDKVLLPLEKTDYADNIYWVFGLVIKNKKVKACEAMKKLQELGIGSRPFFYPMHQQPVFHKMNLFSNEKYPVAENLAEYGFYIPSGLTLTDKDMEKVVYAVFKVLN
jgi:perosamine synthetase